LTADEWYARCPAFLAGLETLGQRYVVEIRRNIHGWFCDPRSETRAVYRDVETLCPCRAAIGNNASTGLPANGSRISIRTPRPADPTRRRA
jgi:hypothetical protein